jgi:hypothetical protein
MLMRKTPSPFLSTTFFALLAGGVSNAAVIQIAVEADTYIRNDAAGPNTINDGDADNEIIIGVNGSSTAELRGLLRFDLAPLLGMMGGTINSVTLTGTTRTGAPGGQNATPSTLTLDVFDYGFEFVEANASFNNPAGNGADTTAGGTVGTLLSTESVLNPASLPSGQSVVFGDSAAFRTAVSDQLAGDLTLNLLVIGTSNTDQSFLRFDDEDRPNPFLLTVDIVPEPSSALLAALGSLLVLRRRQR